MVIDNPLMKGAHGRLSGVSFYQAYGKTLVRSLPKQRKRKNVSEVQQMTRMNFKAAAQYAKVILEDPERKVYYTRKAKEIGVRNAYTAAISDYMRQLTIESVDTTRYTGKVGDEVRIVARKKAFAARSLAVTVRTRSGELIERGEAARDRNGNWVFRNTVATVAHDALMFQVVATGWGGRTVTGNYEKSYPY